MLVLSCYKTHPEPKKECLFSIPKGHMVLQNRNRLKGGGNNRFTSKENMCFGVSLNRPKGTICYVKEDEVLITSNKRISSNVN